MSWSRIAIAISALLGLLAQPALADTDELTFGRGSEFIKLRPELLKAGWKPVITLEQDENGTPINQLGEAGNMYRAGFIEVETCSGPLVHCLFYYSRGNECLQIITDGPYIQLPTGHLPRLVRWTSDCHPPEPVPLRPRPRKKS